MEPGTQGIQRYCRLAEELFLAQGSNPALEADLREKPGSCLNPTLALHMDTSLKHKLIEIIVEKGLIGLLILLAGFLLDSSLERYKLVEAQRVGDTSELVKACSDIWGKVYEYEATLGEIEQMKHERWIVRRFDKRAEPRLEKSIKTKELVGVQKIQEVNKLVHERRFVIGDELARHYWQYIGFLNMRAKAEDDARELADGETRKNAQEVVEELDKQLAAMRFTAMAAREHAVSRLPR